VPRRDRLGVEPLGPLDERGELQIAVAVHARDRRPARRVLADEVRDDVLFERPLEIDDVMRNADRGGDAARVIQVVERAAAAERDLAVRLIVQLHRQPDDVVPLAREKRGGHRAVHTA
jgi:hypothetical protein